MKRACSYFAALAMTLLFLSACAAPADAQEVQALPERIEVPAEPSAPPEPVEQTPEERQGEFLDFLAEVNAQRKAVYENPEPVPFDESWTPDLGELEGQFTEEQMARFQTPPEDASDMLTAEEAGEDIEVLFALLKHVYGGYDYFGGDDVFLPIRDELLGRISGTISASVLESRLAAALSPALMDGHFRIGSVSMSDLHAKYMYYVPDVYFDDPSGIDPELVKRTVDDEGRIRYGLAVLAAPEESAALPASLEIEGGTVATRWSRDPGAVWDGEEVFTESALADGTPLLTSAAMWAWTDEGWAQLERLAECGEEYQDAPLLVFDVRGNGGGDSQYFHDWFEGYAGQSAPSRLIYCWKYSPLIKARFGISGSPGWEIRDYGSACLESDRIVLFLQDKQTASAGEMAGLSISTLENTLRIGGNTAGCLQVGCPHSLYLPNSGIWVQMGYALIQSLDSVNRDDGTGYFPDLWVPSAQALEAAERLITYYDLKNLDLA